jgi:inorganic pyrophosphatase
VSGHSFFARPHRTDGLPVGWGEVAGARLEDGSQLHALVLMSEPALPVRAHAWPIGILHLGQRASEDVLVCVAEEDTFVDLTDLVHCAGWNAELEAWLDALRRVRPQTPRHAYAYDGHEAAESLVARTTAKSTAGMAEAQDRDSGQESTHA